MVQQLSLSHSSKDGSGFCSRREFETHSSWMETTSSYQWSRCQATKSISCSYLDGHPFLQFGMRRATRPVNGALWACIDNNNVEFSVCRVTNKVAHCERRIFFSTSTMSGNWHSGMSVSRRQRTYTDYTSQMIPTMNLARSREKTV